MAKISPGVGLVVAGVALWAVVHNSPEAPKAAPKAEETTATAAPSPKAEWSPAVALPTKEECLAAATWAKHPPGCMYLYHGSQLEIMIFDPRGTRRE
jgi:hypothetical protein